MHIFQHIMYANGLAHMQITKDNDTETLTTRSAGETMAIICNIYERTTMQREPARYTLVH